jgi:FKBP-type peptidyl-prolyl cis-trans isomerase 2
MHGEGRRIAAAVLALGLGAGAAALAQSESPARIVDGKKVTMEFTVSLPDNTVVATTEGQEPLSYVQGKGQIVPGLEKALLGLKVGDKKHIEVPPDQAYGPYDEKKRLTVPKSQVPVDVQVGSLLQDRNGQPVRVLEISDTSVVLDQNHPLAGKILTFDVHILKVESAGTP